MQTQIAVRLPEELLAGVDALVPELHSSRADAVRRAIELYLRRLANEHDAARYDEMPLTDAELAMARNDRSWDSTPTW